MTWGYVVQLLVQELHVAIYVLDCLLSHAGADFPSLERGQQACSRFLDKLQEVLTMHPFSNISNYVKSQLQDILNDFVVFPATWTSLTEGKLKFNPTAHELIFVWRKLRHIVMRMPHLTE